MKDFFRRAFCLVLTVILGASFCVPVRAEEINTFSEIQLLKGDMTTIPAAALSKVSITDPNIADISDAKPGEVSVLGKEPGQTVLFVWDAGGKRTIVIRVLEEDMALVRARLAALLESSNLKELELSDNYYEGKVVITGSLSEDRMADLQKLIEPFGPKVMNMVKREAIDDMIQIDMQVTELSTTLSKALGVDWFTGTQTFDPATNTFTTTHGTELAPTFVEAMPTQNGRIEDLFKIGKWYRSSNSALVAQVNALIKEGKARILSKPRLVVKNGKEATFLVGGEVPIETTTTTAAAGGTQTTSTTFKQYGVSLSVTPTLRQGKVDILLNVQISDIDASKPTGNDVAFITRSAQTQLYLDNRQTIVLAGMIRKRDSTQVSKVPVLGSIPFIGALFRSTKTPTANEDTEVVISLTPTIIHASEALQAAKPQEATAVFQPQAEAPVVPQVVENAPAMVPEESRNTAAVPAISKNAASVASNVPSVLAPYAQLVQGKISSSIAYPYDAQQNGWQGTVKLGLVLKRDGTLKDAYVKESSGYDIFDQDALNTAQILAPYSAFPAGIDQDELSLTIPIVYNMDSFLKNVAKRN